MSIVTLSAKDGIDKKLNRLIKKSRNLKPAMLEVDMLVMRPLRAKAWAKSGLKSRSGELKDSVETWHGKKSAGISVHTKPGKDLVIPKAVMQTKGARRGQYRKKRQYKVRAHRRAGRSIGAHMRRNIGAPWGNVKARPFIPTKLGAAATEQIKRILKKHINV